MANTATGPARRGGVRKGHTWRSRACQALAVAHVWIRNQSPERQRAALREALQIIIDHSRRTETRVEASELLARLED